jgi:hypothetical protein
MALVESLTFRLLAAIVKQDPTFEQVIEHVITISLGAPIFLPRVQPPQNHLPVLGRNAGIKSPLALQLSQFVGETAVS